MVNNVLSMWNLNGDGASPKMVPMSIIHDSSPEDPTISAAQLRAARAMLNWSREDAASHCGVARNTIARLESDERAPTARLMVDILDGFTRHGVVFVNDGAGVGVYLRAGHRERSGD